jgi:hypothetical protein
MSKPVNIVNTFTLLPPDRAEFFLTGSRNRFQPTGIQKTVYYGIFRKNFMPVIPLQEEND